MYLYNFVLNRNQADKVYFPMFCMGNSLISLISQILRNSLSISTIPSIYYDKSFNIRMVTNGANTFLTGNLSDSDILSIMQSGKFLNR